MKVLSLAAMFGIASGVRAILDMIEKICGKRPFSDISHFPKTQRFDLTAWRGL